MLKLSTDETITNSKYEKLVNIIMSELSLKSAMLQQDTILPESMCDFISGEMHILKELEWFIKYIDKE